MNKLNNKRRVQVIESLIEGNSIRASALTTRVTKNTIVKLLEDIGIACLNYQDEAFNNLTCRHIQCDEIWSFVSAKSKNIPNDKQGEAGFGDVWTWVAIDTDTKLVPCWHVGRRDAIHAYEFINDLAGRFANRVQLSTDGYKTYLEAVKSVFGCAIDYAMLVKIYDKSQKEIRCSSPQWLASEKRIVSSEIDKKDVSTGYGKERNLNMRMSTHHFTNFTGRFSKKVKNHIHAISLHYMHYNFVRIHKTLRATPAMAAGITKHLWKIEDIVNLLDSEYAKKD